jgi:hypothetical protein
MWKIYFNPDALRCSLKYNLKIGITCLFGFEIVYSCLSDFSAIRRLSPLQVTCCKLDLHVCLASMVFSSEGSFACHTCCDTVPQFICSHPRVPQRDSNPRRKDHHIPTPSLSCGNYILGKYATDLSIENCTLYKLHRVL